jgi:hypothetical protein
MSKEAKMVLLWILLPCLACGALFAYLAAWLTTKKGNTISDVLNSQKFSDSEAIKVEILDKLKVSSNLPIVALFVVAFAVAICLPAFISWQVLQDVTVIKLSGEIRNLNPDKKPYVSPKGMRIENSGSFEIPLLYSKEDQFINIEGELYSPITMRISLSKLKNSLIVETKREKFEIPLNLETRTASLNKPIILELFSQPGPLHLPNLPSKETPISAEFRDALASPGAPK